MIAPMIAGVSTLQGAGAGASRFRLHDASDDVRRRARLARAAARGCSGCSARTPRSFPIMAAVSAIRAKPARGSPPGCASPWGGMRASAPGAGRRHDAATRSRNAALLRKRCDAADRRRAAVGAPRATSPRRPPPSCAPWPNMIMGKPMSDAAPEPPPLRQSSDDFRWAGVDLRLYKEESAAPFKAVSRQVLFSDPRLMGELRYFEIAAWRLFDAGAPRAHACGDDPARRGTRARRRDRPRGQAARPRHGPALDLASVPRDAGETLGFLCLVDATRDRPQLPTPEELAALRADPEGGGVSRWRGRRARLGVRAAVAET